MKENFGQGCTRTEEQSREQSVANAGRKVDDALRFQSTEIIPPST
jgi:hypothetical protein